MNDKIFQQKENNVMFIFSFNYRSLKDVDNLKPRTKREPFFIPEKKLYTSCMQAIPKLKQFPVM